MSETADQRADRLAEIAVELVVRIRDEPPDANWRWLLAKLPDPLDREALSFVLAAAVPIDMPWMTLTHWARIWLDGVRPKPTIYQTGAAA